MQTINKKTNKADHGEGSMCRQWREQSKQTTVRAESAGNGEEKIRQMMEKTGWEALDKTEWAADGEQSADRQLRGLCKQDCASGRQRESRLKM